jgi:hypothetical protein
MFLVEDVAFIFDIMVQSYVVAGLWNEVNLANRESMVINFYN